MYDGHVALGATNNFVEQCIALNFISMKRKQSIRFPFAKIVVTSLTNSSYIAIFWYLFSVMSYWHESNLVEISLK